MQGQSLGQKIRRRQKQMENIRQPAESDWKVITDILMPGLTYFDGNKSEGHRVGTSSYTSGPARHLRTAADGIMGSMVSPHIRWLALLPQDPELSDIREVREYYQDCEEQLYYGFENSNFYSVLPAHIRAGLAIGNSCLIDQEDIQSGKVVYKTPHPREVYFGLNHLDEVAIFHRKFELEAYRAAGFFGADNEGLSQPVKNNIQNNQDAKTPFLQAIYHNSDPILDGKTYPQEWVEFYIDLSQPEGGAFKPLRQAGYHYWPVSPWRFEINSDEIYGRGIGHLALADILGLNQYAAGNLVGFQQVVDPALLAPLDLRGRIRRKAGGITYYDSVNGTPPVDRLYKQPPDMQAGLTLEERTEEAIREWFSVSFFTMLSDMVRDGGSPPTATQVMEMAGEKAMLLISRVGRLNTETLDSVVKRRFVVEHRAGRLPDPPQILMDSGGVLPQIDYVGPLAQLQKQMIQLRPIREGMAQLGMLAEFDPSVVHAVKMGELAEEVLKKTIGFPQHVVRTQREYEAIMQAMQERAEQDRQMQQAAMAADAVPKLQGKTEEGSPMGNLADALR